MYITFLCFNNKVFYRSFFSADSKNISILLNNKSDSITKGIKIKINK